MTPELESFLRHFLVDVAKAHQLAHELHHAFRGLAAESLDQFLPTPISESILRPTKGSEKGRGGTNVRVGFVELLGSEAPERRKLSTTNGNHADNHASSNLRRVLEKSWPIQEHLKNDNADSLFTWIGRCIAEVVGEGVEVLGLDRDGELPMGVTFSFPIAQSTLSRATIRAMGKGFAITSGLDLAVLLENGYRQSKAPDIPQIKVAAILNDAVATLVSFIYQYQEDDDHKAAMGFICGTGTNATIPLRLNTLNLAKRPGKIAATAEDEVESIRIAVNTEWSIKGSAPPLRKLDLISKWDMQLDSDGEVPGFQPLEYMTAGRYLGELARLIFLDYIKTHLGLTEETIPRHHYRPLRPSLLLNKLEAEFPPGTSRQALDWTEESAVALFYIAKAIQVRASALIAAAIVGLLACADDIPLSRDTEQRLTTEGWREKKLVVGYTGACIVHFQDYLSDCQSFLDSIIRAEFGDGAPVEVVLSPCHDGGITGAGVLCGLSQASSTSKNRTADSDDEPNEQTALLGGEERSRAGITSASATRQVDPDGNHPERDLLVAYAPVPTAEGNDDLEANNGNGNGDDTAGDGGDDTPEYLINTNRRKFLIAFVGIMLTYTIGLFDSTIMASSHPVITSYFRASNKASWLTTSYTLTSTAFQPFVARLSDTLGRKPLYICCMVIFTGGTAGCALAPSMNGFIAARALCGLGCGGMMTLGAISINDLMPIERRGPYQGFINVIYGVAASLGAAFGGVMADTLGWRWEFGIQLFPLALCIAIAYFTMPIDLGLETGKARETLMQALRGLDVKGSIALTTSTTFLILGLNLGGNVLPWSHPFVITSLSIFAVACPTFLWIESRAERPIIPLALLHSSPRANIIFANTLASFLLNAILFNAPLFFQAVLLKTPTQSGLYLLVPTLVSSAVGFMTGFLIKRTGGLKWALVCGVLGFVFGTALLSSPLMARGWPLWAYLACLVPAAAGQGFQFSGSTLSAQRASLQREQGTVTATLQLCRNLGHTLGVACTSLVFQNALLAYLLRNVTAGEGEEERRRFIEKVRASVAAVRNLPDGLAKDQVVMSYEAACRVTFLVCFGVAVVSMLSILPIKVPRLTEVKK
ncbi:MFS general substrate transporter [Xylariaceae sp. FL0594]|nr:MFS general substrate transporter [Xylariaceae sp. FL0594]